MTTQVPPYPPVISIVRDGGSVPLRLNGGDGDTLVPFVHGPLSNINPRQDLNVPKRPEFDFLEKANAIRFGLFPDNETIISWLRSMYDATKLDNQRQLSEDGRKLLQDFRYLLKAIRYMLREKNQDQKIQQFVRLVYEGTRKLRTEDAQGKETEATERAGTWEDAKKGYEAMYTIGRLLVTNEEFTSLLRDITIIIRDMFGDVARVMSDIVRPSQEERARVFPDAAGQGCYETEQLALFEFADNAQAPNEDLVDKSARYVSEKVSPDVRQSLIQRLKKAIVQVQRDESYQAAVIMLFDLLKQWGNRATDAGKEVQSLGGRIKQDETWLRTESLLKQIIEAFAQNRSLDPLGQALSTFLGHVRQDPEIERYFEELDHYLKRLLKEPGYLNKDESSSDGNELIDRGRTLLQKRYKEDTDKLIKELIAYSQALYSDPVTRMLATRFRAFGRDLLFDHKNRMRIKPQLFNDFRTTFFPMIFQHIKNFAIPRFEFTDKNYDVVIENIVLTSDSFLPRQVNIRAQNHFVFSLTHQEEYSHSHSTHIELHGLHAEARDLVFYYKKKTGLVHVKDIGSATIKIGGRGISIHTKLSLMNSGSKLYDISSVQCVVHDLNTSIHGKKHSLLYLALKPVFDGMIKNQIERTIEHSVRDMLIKFEAGLSWLNQMFRPEKCDDFESDDDILFENGEHAKRVMMSNLFRRSPTLTSRPNSLVPVPSFSSNDDDDDYDEKGKTKKGHGEPSAAAIVI